ncbi:hypothetical protein A0H81_06667 [Grifola frondosa]|uniref:Heterokaryon incompatibility domain-containing protein n=1 Tax=Grifola frondosa TaxID=5627 RepID=A0A1C7MAM0_GRIFR|nr:hypothetical protein A0H81_06667 [Grifola frondosa]
MARQSPTPDSTIYEACGTFTVSGAEASDPISIAVLRHACTASLQAGAPNLWLDRLCIIETDANDKAWQISRMHQIYASCVVCLVLPGGIRRLVGLDEETPWIHRAWTLQEAVAPHRVEVLFAWTRGAVTGASGSTEPLWPQAVIPTSRASRTSPPS